MDDLQHGILNLVRRAHGNVRTSPSVAAQMRRVGILNQVLPDQLRGIEQEVRKCKRS